MPKIFLPDPCYFTFFQSGTVTADVEIILEYIYFYYGHSRCTWMCLFMAPMTKLSHLLELFGVSCIFIFHVWLSSKRHSHCELDKCVLGFKCNFRLKPESSVGYWWTLTLPDFSIFSWPSWHVAEQIIKFLYVVWGDCLSVLVTKSWWSWYITSSLVSMVLNSGRPSLEWLGSYLTH